jgi:hypothetical protein
MALIDDQHLAVVPNEIVIGARDCYAGRQQAHLERAQTFLASAVGIRNQGAYGDAAPDRLQQRVLNLRAIEAEDKDIHAFFSVVDSFREWDDAIARLNDELHAFESQSARNCRMRSSTIFA